MASLQVVETSVGVPLRKEQHPRTLSPIVRGMEANPSTRSFREVRMLASQGASGRLSCCSSSLRMTSLVIAN